MDRTSITINNTDNSVKNNVNSVNNVNNVNNIKLMAHGLSIQLI